MMSTKFQGKLPPICIGFYDDNPAAAQACQNSMKLSHDACPDYDCGISQVQFDPFQAVHTACYGLGKSRMNGVQGIIYRKNLGDVQCYIGGHPSASGHPAVKALSGSADTLIGIALITE
jgi:hypothetical protein